MSWNPSVAHDAGLIAAESIETVIVPRSRDIGGFEVRRALPVVGRRTVGPFVFFDQAGPAEFVTGEGIDVRPHPHIGLGTVTYLYRGEFQHRDSLGSDQLILPGEVNWMVSGRAVTHSERTSAETRKNPHSLLGIQTWVALPKGAEDSAASFEHHGKEALPVLDAQGITARVIMGRAWGQGSPVSTFTDMFYVDAAVAPHHQMPLPDDHEDRGIYILDGSIDVAGDTFDAGRMLVFRPGDKISVRAGATGARLLLLGGATLDEPRHMWWNFVSSSKEKIEEAKEHWQAERWGEGIFDLPVGDENEWIPLP